MSCNSSCDCCSGNCETQDTCHQDNVGVPRCAAAQCVGAGGACASSANCCNGAPCVPNPTPGAAPPYVCYAAACVPACGSCTNNADCCVGTSCIIAQGSTHGVCGPCGAPSSGGDAGPGNYGDGGTGGYGDSGSSGYDGGTPQDSGGYVPPPPPDAGCALYGQLCTTSADCCNHVTCNGGRCLNPQ
jgi:hypothetical protein